ncbi:hypothetical protein ACFU99_08650 [Streptomyces sp. NPDC057654]|uniref:hypothetical protein n=1 Tax=Streptomyces sp. NPDC057654 TaxID=3346196 RepID=UPI0036B42B0B
MSSKERREREELRTARRDSLLVLMSRAERGVLTRPEAAQLRQHVEAELTLADQTRASASGQRAANQRMRAQLDAAHAAVVEAEGDRRHAEERAEKVEQQLAEAEETSLRHARYLADAQRACGAPDWPSLAATIRATAREALHAADRYRGAWRSARRRATALAQLTPAPIQQCSTCGAGYTLGTPCGTCDYRARIVEHGAHI